MLRILLSLLCFGAVLSAQKPLEERINASLERARPALLEYLRKARSGELALVCLAAVHDGMDRDEQDFRRALSRLAKARLSGTYETSIRLMVLANFQDMEDREEIAAADAKALIDRQTGSGGFSYGFSDDSWDLSNTQYAALGLRAAASMYQTVPETVWRNLLHCVAEAQKENGGFCYVVQSPAAMATASMTVAGIAVLEICLQQLELEDREEARMREAIDRAWQWMAENKETIGREESALVPLLPLRSRTSRCPLRRE